jgi:hypothetical protein
MRPLIAWTLALAIGASAEKAASITGDQSASERIVAADTTSQSNPLLDPAAELKAREEMNALLDEWEKQNKKISSLDIEFERIDKAQAWGDQYFKGRAMFKSPDLACLEFTKIKLDAKGKPIMTVSKDGKPTKAVEADPTERIVFTTKEVLHYTWDDHKIFVYPLDSWVARMFRDSFGCGLPFLLNVRAADMKELYKMTLLKQDVKEYLIQIEPKMDKNKKSFHKAYLWLNKETYLPDHLRVYPAGGNNRQEFHFSGGKSSIHPNAALEDKFFAFRKIPGWKIVENPAPFSWLK